MDYDYDAHGNRVRKTIDDLVTMTYLVDENRDYAQVLEERDGEGNLLVRYVYGHDLISQTRGTDTSYYHYDGLGSTRALTNSSEAVTDTYTYDAFGLLLEQTGTTKNHYLYRGEQFDEGLGFYYLRARYMDPAIGRFVTMDSFSGVSQDPISLHKYLYANANPITYSDPSGNFSITEIQTGTAIRGILSRIGTVAKINQYRKTIGMLGGAMTNMIDTWLGGGDLGDVLLSGVIGGATGAAGVAIGGYLVNFPRLICTLKYLSPVIGALGLSLELKGIEESIEKGEYDQAAFRSVLAIFTIKGIANAWKTRGCFTEETLISTKEGYKQIKDIEVGDEVYSENIATGEKGLKRVKKVFVREIKILIHLLIDNVKIKTTPEHPFWVPQKGWVAAGELMVGDEVKLYSDERREIASIKQEVLTFPIKVYNFEVEEWHTYYVGNNHILVHNTYKIPPKVKVINSNMDHAAKRAVERAGFSSKQEARAALQALSDMMEDVGIPTNAIPDPAHADRIIVPGLGEGGAVVYQITKKGKLRLKTVLKWMEP